MSSVAPGIHSHVAIRRSRRVNLRGDLGIWLIRLLVILFCLLVLLPAFWVVSASIQPGSSAYSSSLFPKSFSLDNYHRIIDAGFWTWLKNSILVCGVAALISLFINVIGAYAFSRLRFWGRRYGILILFLIQVFPLQMAIPAIYTLEIKINAFDTLPGLALVFLGGSAFNMWLMKNYFDELPRELDEAAIVDGATSWGVFWAVLLPLMRPMLVTIFIFAFYGAYNDILWNLTLIHSPDNYTVTVGLYYQITGNFATNWALFAAGAILASLPMLVVFLGMQRLLVSGLSSGSVKG